MLLISVCKDKSFLFYDNIFLIQSKENNTK